MGFVGEPERLSQHSPGQRPGFEVSKIRSAESAIQPRLLNKPARSVLYVSVGS